MLAQGLGAWCEGVVFLDSDDRQMVLLMDGGAPGAVLPVREAGLDKTKRFTFFDQVRGTRAAGRRWKWRRERVAKRREREMV